MTKSWTRVLDLWDPVGPHGWPLGNVNLSDEWIFKCAQDRAALWPYDLCKAGLRLTSHRFARKLRVDQPSPPDSVSDVDHYRPGWIEIETYEPYEGY
ncbi:hypothetical protein A7D00_0190 [Trichophyton violaceum]|uniref:Uncharacterized protein n=1 Tax=Trichophyton violaceum TaxID=34388 RepID=A0A178FRQ0_TRIVO|nr:hypothetical protein A7D00_0190 [Trichophyton violaceum]